MRIVHNPSPSELRAHQIAYYTMLMKESKSDGQKRFLRTQLYHLKQSNHECSNRPVGGLRCEFGSGTKILSLN